MRSIIRPILNTLSLLAALFVNYWVNAGNLNGKSVGAVSDKYGSLFTPAGYAFSIWGLIYLLLLCYVGYQWYQWHTGRQIEQMERSGYWFTLANIANGAWVIAWVYELTGLSVLIMLVLLFSLVQLVIKLDLERWDAPLDVIAFIWWPLSIYLGWIILATVSNIAAFLASVGWDGSPLTPQAWTIWLIIVSTVVYVLLTVKRFMREASAVGIWGLVAIAVAQWDSNPGIVYAAISGAVVLLITAGYQGYKNRKVSALAKLSWP